MGVIDFLQTIVELVFVSYIVSLIYLPTNKSIHPSIPPSIL